MLCNDHFLCQNTFEDIFIDYYVTNYKNNQHYEAYNYFAPWLITFSRINRHMYYKSLIFKSLIILTDIPLNGKDCIDSSLLILLIIGVNKGPESPF